MAVSILPSLIDALVTQARVALPALQVFDGYGASEDPGDFLMIGVDDPDAPTPADSAESVQDWGPYRASGSKRDEQGSITCAALSWNGNGDVKAARDAAFASVGAVSTLLRNDPTLGLSPSLLWARFGSVLDLSQQQDGSAVQAVVLFRVAFQARI